jgi:adenosylcobinamide amidohydrolase
MVKSGNRRTGVLVRIFAILSILLISAAGMACHQNDVVRYEVTGNADSVDITVNTDSGGTEQYNDVGVPWRMEYGGFSESYTYIYAHNNGDYGTINIFIYVNGKLFRSATSSGPYCYAVVYGDK